jgi:hypothetical protein
MSFLDEDDTPKLRPVRRKPRDPNFVFHEDPDFVPEPRFIPGEYTPIKIYPIADINSYIDARGFKKDSPAAQQLRELYGLKQDDFITEEKPPKISFKDPEYVSVKFVVTDKRVKLKLAVPLDEYESWRSKGKMPPIAVRVRAAKASGFPDEVLERMIARDDAWKAKSDALDQFLVNIFGEKPSKVSKPKPKTKREQLESLIKKKPKVVKY